MSPPEIRSTTVVAVRKEGKLAMACDGQVSFGQTIMKNNAVKIRRLFQNRVLVGFAGATADAFTLCERLEAKLEYHRGDLARSAVSLAKDWRQDRYLRRLEAMLVAGDADHLLLVSGTGDVVEPEDTMIAIGSGGNFALAAARALYPLPDWDSRAIVTRSLEIAGDICLYTNSHLTIEEL
ncbi:MAG: ATP-dependent protease subunit HslV [Alphaproteobacteria bacterium]|nr:ATP-dependent protease subunit HslV [Alphaproteobacteria bacterium]